MNNKSDEIKNTLTEVAEALKSFGIRTFVNCGTASIDCLDLRLLIQPNNHIAVKYIYAFRSHKTFSDPKSCVESIVFKYRENYIQKLNKYFREES